MKKGISLIVLVITIIVMIILAAAVIIAMNNNGVIDRANQAVNLTNEKQVQDLASLLWAEAYLDPDKKADIENVVKTELAKQGVTETDWNIQVSITGVTVTSKNSSGVVTPETKNEVTVTIKEATGSSIYDLEEFIITINGVRYTELGVFQVPANSEVECTYTTPVLGYEHVITYNGETVVTGKNTPYTFEVNQNVEISLGYNMGDSSIDIVQN